jgi:S1-C subfamily serine protease
MKSRLFWIIAIALLIGLGVVIGGGVVYFGMQTTPVEAATWLQTTPDRNAGILVGAVEAGSPADQAGIVRGDIILKANDTAITTPNRPMDLLKDLKPGDSLTLNVLHGDTARDVTITLGDKNGVPFLGISPAYTAPFGRGMFGFLPPANGQNLAPGVTGARVTEVIAGSPAEKAGLKVGDIILKVNDQALDGSHDLATVLGAMKVGDTVTLNVQRSGETTPLDIKATLGENPNQANQAYLGIRYQMIMKGQGTGPLPNLPFQKGPGLFVSAVTAGSPAEKAGLKPNDVITQVNGSSVTTGDALAKQVQAAKPGDKLTLTVNRSGEQNPLTIEVTLAADPNNNGQTYLGVTLGGMNRGFQRRFPPTNPKPGTTGSNT